MGGGALCKHRSIPVLLLVAAPSPLESPPAQALPLMLALLGAEAFVPEAFVPEASVPEASAPEASAPAAPLKPPLEPEGRGWLEVLLALEEGLTSRFS